MEAVPTSAPSVVTPAVVPTQSPALPVTEPQVTRDQAYANAVDVSKRTDSEGVTTPASAPTVSQTPEVPAQSPQPTDYVWNPQSGKYEAKA